MEFGTQLYGVFKGSDFTPAETFEKIRNSGTHLIEPCISTFEISGMTRMIWPVACFRELMPVYLSQGLTAVSCHIFSTDLLADMDILKELAQKNGIRQFVVKSPEDLSEKSLQETALNYMQVSERLAEVGAELLLHNEEQDIRTKVHGKTAFEYLLDQCHGRVFAQVDVGWVLAGGEDPESLLWRNEHRVKSLHYKDFFKTADGAWQESVIGEGELDLTACYQFARAHGIPQICDQDDSEAGVFTDLAIAVKNLRDLAQAREHTVSYLNILDTQTGAVRVLHRFNGVIEAPNWLKKENALLYNAEGRIWHYDIDRDECRMLESGKCDMCNNDHVISPDETQIAISHSRIGAEEGSFDSWIYVLPIEGGKPVKVTPNSPSFLHGWSPDGKEFAYCAFRMQENGLQVDIYTIPSEGGQERRLTDGGFNDGPEYSPDGNHIWFNSTRSGLMQIFRMHRDGSGCTQMTDNDRNNWFPHISPNGQEVVYLSYRKGDLEPSEHLPNMPVEIWKMKVDGSGKEKIISFFGGQGSINVNSWSKDNRHVAFVSYELLRKD